MEDEDLEAEICCSELLMHLAMVHAALGNTEETVTLLIYRYIQWIKYKKINKTSSSTTVHFHYQSEGVKESGKASLKGSERSTFKASSLSISLSFHSSLHCLDIDAHDNQ